MLLPRTKCDYTWDLDWSSGLLDSSTHTSWLHRSLHFTALSGNVSQQPTLLCCPRMLADNSHQPPSLPSQLSQNYSNKKGQSYVMTEIRRPVCFNIKPPSGVQDQICIAVDSCEFVSDERTSLYFTVAAVPRQRSHSRVRYPWESWPYFAVSNSRPPHVEGQVSILESPGTGFPLGRLQRFIGLQVF